MKPKQRAVPPANGAGPERETVERLTLSNVKTIYGCSELFNLEAQDALMSLSFSGIDQFLDWLGWVPTNECLIKKYFLNWVRPNKSGTFTAGYLADPCADPNTFEWDVCDFTLTDFARLRRGGPVRDITKKDISYTWNQPRYRLDGSPIVSDREFDYRLAMEVLLQDLRTMTITGNSATPGMFSGLQQLIKYNYQSSTGAYCKMMDSIVIDWNKNLVSGGNGITWNGTAVANTYSLIDVLMAVFRRLRHRIRMSPALNSQRLQEGDIVLVMPEDFVNCVLDAYTCWAVCSGNMNQMQTFEARTFRNNLLGGMFGAGRIEIDSFPIPILPYDFGTIVSGQTFDMYMLTGNVGNVKTLHGQFNDMSGVPGESLAPKYALDGGRFLSWEETDHTCIQRYVEFQPRLLNWAPWAQARISNIVCTVPGGVISSDPTSTYFLY